MSYRTPADLFPDYNAALHGFAPRVVIAYDQLPNGRRAMRMLATTFERFDDLPGFHASVWRLDLLEDPHWASMAAKNVHEADIIVVAVSSRNTLTSGVRKWIEGCLKQKEGDAAVVLLMQTDLTESEPENGEDVQFLQELAAKAGVDFLAPDIKSDSRDNGNGRPSMFFAEPNAAADRTRRNDQ
ncbi:MAG: hypothetical protein ACXW32_14545 [Limisphaerales bacterium]